MKFYDFADIARSRSRNTDANELQPNAANCKQDDAN